MQTRMTVDQYRSSKTQAAPGGAVVDWVWNQVKKAIGDNVLQPAVVLQAEHDAIDWLGTFVLGTGTRIDDAAYKELIVDHESDFDNVVHGAIDFLRNRLGLDPVNEGPVHFMALPPAVIADKRTRFHGICRMLAVGEMMKSGKYKTRRQALEALNAKVTDVDWNTQANKPTSGVPTKAIGDGTILNWLFDHKDEILAFVLQILKLFVLI